jgi:hypothetical protein
LGQTGPVFRISFTDAQLEALKWIALASMFIDHFGRHLLGVGHHSWVFAAGRVAFPLFAFVLAVNLARPGDRAGRAARSAVRLAFACAISQLPSIWARGEPELVNIFGTFALGAVLCWLFAAAGHIAWRALGCVAVATASHHVEFDLMGVFLVPAIYLWRAEGRRDAAALACVLFIAVALLNGSFGGAWGAGGTLMAIPLAMLVAQAPVGAPRLAMLFYAVYPIHLALIGALKRAGGVTV